VAEASGVISLDSVSLSKMRKVLEIFTKNHVTDLYLFIKCGGLSSPYSSSPTFSSPICFITMAIKLVFSLPYFFIANNKFQHRLFFHRRTVYHQLFHCHAFHHHIIGFSISLSVYFPASTLIPA
jgi:hypothetical protein